MNSGRTSCWNIRVKLGPISNDLYIMGKDITDGLYRRINPDFTEVWRKIYYMIGGSNCNFGYEIDSNESYLYLGF
jgi:hypothetical protein